MAGSLCKRPAKALGQRHWKSAVLQNRAVMTCNKNDINRLGMLSALMPGSGMPESRSISDPTKMGLLSSLTDSPNCSNSLAFRTAPAHTCRKNCSPMPVASPLSHLACAAGVTFFEVNIENCV